jgi:PAS domain S-box-containing protein
MATSSRARLLLALLPVAVIFVVQWLGWEVFKPYAWFLFVLAVTISSAVGGLRSGLIATALSGALVWWFFIPPEHALAKEPRLFILLSVFFITGASISVIADRWIRAHERLQRVSEERRIFAALIDNSSDFVGIADATGTPVYVNPAGRRMVALPANTRLETTRIAEYYSLDQQEFAQNVIVKAMTEQGHWHGETYFRNWETNAPIPVSDVHFMIRDPDTNAVIGAGTITRDISDLRRAQEEVETANERLRTLFESAPDGIFISDLDTRFTSVNAAASRLTGYSRDELLGMRITDLLRPEDAARLQRDKQEMLAGSSVVGEWALRRKDGVFITVEVTATILPDGRWQAIARDTSVRKQLETALAAKSADFERAQSVAQIGSWRHDIQRDELRWSDEAYRIFGVPLGTALTYEAFLACVHPDDREYVDRSWAAGCRGAPYDIQHRLLVAGETKWVREKAELEFDAQGVLLGGVGITQDITERKRLEEEIRQAHERFELALAGADLAAWDWNIETGEVHLSKRWAEMRGYTADHIAARIESWTEGIHPDDLPRVRAALDDHFARRTAEYECEFRVQTKSGSWIWVLDRGKVFARSAEGKPTRMLGTELDITMRKQAETELRLAHETTSGILSISADAIISLDEQFRITMFNASAEKIFGYTRAEAIGAPVGILVPEGLRAAQRQRLAAFVAGSEMARHMGTSTAVLFGRRKNGDEFPADAALSKLAVGGRVILTATIRDISEQRRIEHEQQFLAEVGPILASSLDYEKTLDRVAQLAVRELASLCVVDIVSVDGKVRRLKAICRDPQQTWIAEGLMRASLDPNRPYLTRAALANRESVLVEQLTDEIVASYAQSDEHLKLLLALKPTSMIAVPLVAHDKLLGAIALVASASSQRFGIAELRLTQELARRAALAIEGARLYAAAQRAIEARDDVLAVVAHDLRNPLGAIGLQADLLRQQEGRTRSAGEFIQRSVARMNRLIQDILDVTRIEAGQLTVEHDRVSTVQMLLDIVDTQRPVAEARGIALLLDITADLPDVWGDRDRLLQICENLIGNALKFTTHGNVTVRAVSRDNDVLVCIKDTGTGIPPERLPHIFDRFWKADKQARRGLGLGLAIVKALVEAHGGQIWVESTLGAGSEFHFTIPKAPPLAPWESAATPQHR